MRGPEADPSVPVFRVCSVCHWFQLWTRSTAIGLCPSDRRHGNLLILTASARNVLFEQAPRDAVQPPRYDRQIVFTIRSTIQPDDINGDTVDDAIVRRAGAALHEKALARGLESELIWVRHADTWPNCLGGLTDESRLYLVGHSNGVTLQGINGAELAQRLKNAGLRHARRITLAACRGGTAPPLFEAIGLAQLLHSTLGRFQPSVRTQVAAYKRPVTIVNEQILANVDSFRDQPWLGGKKIVHDDQDRMHFVARVRQEQKILYVWNGNTQVVLGGSQEVD